jgi:UDP-N-acetylmuramoyl-L-alanyl-D-glutamate--2,6-diaminopimelate ligase
MIGDHILENKIIPKTYPVACHTDNVGLGTTFVAIHGMQKDGLDYIPIALEKGARQIVVDQRSVISDLITEQLRYHQVKLLSVENTRKALAELSAQALGFPAKKLKIIGITGTKGKTTTTFLLEHILRTLGKKTAMLSTVYNKIGDIIVATKLTTQQPDYLHIFFDACVQRGVEYVIMEVAAQAFSLYRVHGLEFDAGIFTNFSQEHGEFYATMDDYFAAKLQIIEHLKPRAPLLINRDDPKSEILNDAYKKIHGKNSELFSIRFVKKSNQTEQFNENIDSIIYSCPALLGQFNQYNIAAATECAEFFGMDSSFIQQALQSFPGVPGRLEKYQLPNGALGVIDYAHTPSSFEAVLSELRTLTNHLIVVFGCGGERDNSKRPIMGCIASTLADYVIITADNPRSENIEIINQQILAGIALNEKNRVEIIEDREQAIRKAYERSFAGSIIVLLGKGPDEYQIVQGVTYPFSEKAILKSL